MTYDYSNVPSYVAPTEGNMEQAATQIANWIRSKGNGTDVRESMAQAVQLFGDVAAQFIKQSDGLKGQFNSAIANANSDTEVQAARTSTATGNSFGTLGLRLDAIDTEQASHDASIKNGLVDKSTDQDVDGVKNFLQLPIINSGRSLLPASDSGWLDDGITFLNGAATNNSTGRGFKYRIITLGALKLVLLDGIVILTPTNLQNGYADGGNFIQLPSSAKLQIYQTIALKEWGAGVIAGARTNDGSVLQIGDVSSGIDKAVNQTVIFNDILFAGGDVND
ncbi:MAG: hypothetical protein ABF682_10060 [Liquorilactobacillus sp.]|uniref:hypothetical protein n=1 Tax=Liquorilactobacillus sp. TaxID=2767923 RepID=UPI0039EA6728